MIFVCAGGLGCLWTKPGTVVWGNEEGLTGYAGLSMIGRLVWYPGLAEMLAEQVKVNRRRCCRDEQMLLGLNLCVLRGSGEGLRALPDSRRLRERLRMAQLVRWRQSEIGCTPVFVDGAWVAGG